MTNISDILAAIKVDEFTGELYGISKATPPEIWNPRFSRLEEWLRKDVYPPSIESRHSLLLMLQEKRVETYARYQVESYGRYEQLQLQSQRNATAAHQARIYKAQQVSFEIHHSLSKRLSMRL